MASGTRAPAEARSGARLIAGEKSDTAGTSSHTPVTSDGSTPAIEAILRDLNQQQRAAVLHGDGPLLIIAGAGTGKTTTLANRVAHQIAGGINPAREGE